MILYKYVTNIYIHYPCDKTLLLKIQSHLKICNPNISNQTSCTDRNIFCWLTPSHLYREREIGLWLNLCAVFSPAQPSQFLFQFELSLLCSLALARGSQSHQGGEVPVVCGQEVHGFVLVLSQGEGQLTESVCIVPGKERLLHCTALCWFHVRLLHAMKESHVTDMSVVNGHSLVQHASRQTVPLCLAQDPRSNNIYHELILNTMTIITCW